MVIHGSEGLVPGNELPPGVSVQGADGLTSQSGAGDAQSGEDNEHRLSRSATEFLKVGEKFVNIEKLNVDLISQINPFQGAYEILSKALNAPMLKTIQDFGNAM